MRSLFFKIFGWFWLTVVLVGAALGISAFYSSRILQKQQEYLNSSLLPAEMNNAMSALQSSGRNGVAEYLKRAALERRIQTFVFDENGQEIFSRIPPPDILKMAAAARGQEGMQLFGTLASKHARGADGKSYTVVMSQLPPDIVQDAKKAARTWQSLVAVTLLIFVAGGIFCYLITRQITAPLVRLREAAAGIAEGRLDTRVGPLLENRHDEIAHLGRDFDRMAERIESLVTGQRRLLGDVSHELRSPLSRLIVALSLVKQGSPDEFPEHLERIALEARRLDKLIGQLLLLSRIDSGVRDAHASFDLTNTVHEVASDGDFEARASSRRVIVMTVDACTISGNEELLRSAIENIVRNAIRFTRENTPVEISLQRQDRPEGERAVLRVRDHGPGVPDTMLSEIFLPFRRVTGAEGSTDSAGLGLAIADRAINVHGGAIRASNAATGGLIVEIELRTTASG